MENSKLTSYKKFRAALRALSPDSRHVFKDQMPVLDGKNWRQGLSLLSDLAAIEKNQLNALFLYIPKSENNRDPLAMACLLGLTASEIVSRFGTLRVEVVDLMEWLLDNDMLRLVDEDEDEDEHEEKDEMGEDGHGWTPLFVEFDGVPYRLH